MLAKRLAERKEKAAAIKASHKKYVMFLTAVLREY